MAEPPKCVWMGRISMVDIGTLYYSIDEACTFQHYGVTDTLTIVLDFDNSGYDGWHLFYKSPINPNYGWRRHDW